MFAAHFPGLMGEEDEASLDEESEEAFFLEEDKVTVFQIFLLLRYWVRENRLDSALVISLCKEKFLPLEETLTDLTYLSIGYFPEKDRLTMPTITDKDK